MARPEVQYSGKERVFEVAVNGCESVGILYRKAQGGCDLYLRLWDSEFDGLEVHTITELRRRGDQQKQIYVADIPGSLLNPLTMRRAKGSLREWLRESFGMEYRFRDRMKEWVWAVADLLNRWITWG